jgi:hypothetical protein
MRVFLGCKLWLSQQRAVKELLPWTDKPGSMAGLRSLLGTNHTARIDHKLA